MKEKTLLQEIEQQQKVDIEEKLISIKEENEKERKQEQSLQDNRKNLFSASAFPQVEVEKLRQKFKDDRTQENSEINKIESKVSSVIEKPNYDYIAELSESQRKKVYVISHEEEAVQPKKRVSKLTAIVISLMFAIFGVWGIVNIATIDNLAGQITEVGTEYELNLINYLKNLYSLDATNSENMENLFETIPDESLPPEQIAKQSNWFDRFCNFIAGLFGG